MGKGGSSSTQEIPYWLEDAAKRNLNQADRISRIGAVPMTYGPTVAAFSPMQNSSFLNTANQANAFGLNAPIGNAATGGMPAPTNYGGGVTGYSAKPVFDAITGEFTDDRPAQASYIDSFFINPFTGTTGINAGNVSDIGYQNVVPVGVGGQPVMGGGSGGGSDPYSGGDSVSDFLDPNGRMGLADHMARQKMNYAGAAQANPGNLIFNYGQDADGGVYAVGYGPDTISSAEAYKMGLTIKDKNPFDMTFGEHMGAMAGDVKNIATTAVEDFAKFSPVSQIVNTLSNNNNNNNNNSNNNDDPAYLSNPAFAAGGSLKAETDLINSNMSDDDFFDALESDSTVGGAVSGNKDNCVIATHAVSTGVYNYQTRRQAEVWCMRKLHDKWWGETIRRGYRYLGRRKIDQGKASEHYDEFKRYIAFATGKRRDLRSALTFTLRSVQFFAVGLFTRNS